MSKFDDMIDWVSGYTRSVNARKALELKEREVRALEAKLKEREVRALEAIAYIKQQLDNGCAYVVLPDNIARKLTEKEPRT